MNECIFRSVTKVRRDLWLSIQISMPAINFWKWWTKRKRERWCLWDRVWISEWFDYEREGIEWWWWNHCRFEVETSRGVANDTTNLEIVKYSMPSPLFLCRPLLNILSQVSLPIFYYYRKGLCLFDLCRCQRINQPNVIRECRIESKIYWIFNWGILLNHCTLNNERERPSR